MILTLDTIQSIDEAIQSVIGDMETVKQCLYVDEPYQMEKTIRVPYKGIRYKMWFKIDTLGGLFFCGSANWNALTHFEIFEVIEKCYKYIA